MKKGLLFLCVLLCTVGCQHELTEYDVVGGRLNKKVVNAMKGFDDNLPQTLKKYNMTYSQFILMSTDSAWALPTATRTSLKTLREGLDKPTGKTLLQKIIPLSEMPTYINNVYGGTVGGFVAYAGDVKDLFTMHDVYWGFRLDYDGTKFSENGVGYAAIRFYIKQPEVIEIPFCPELGGSYPHSWPNGGGGFTTSTLGTGGYPEWKTTTYVEPVDGAELYEMNSNGYEILRAVFTSKTKWQTVDKGYSPQTRAISSEPYQEKHVIYQGHDFILRATIDGICHLATFTDYPEMDLEVLDKGIWGIQVPEGECSSR